MQHTESLSQRQGAVEYAAMRGYVLPFFRLTPRVGFA